MKQARAPASQPGTSLVTTVPAMKSAHPSIQGSGSVEREKLLKALWPGPLPSPALLARMGGSLMQLNGTVHSSDCSSWAVLRT